MIITISDGYEWPQGTTVEADYEKRTLRITVPTKPPPLEDLPLPDNASARLAADPFARFGRDLVELDMKRPDRPRVRFTGVTSS